MIAPSRSGSPPSPTGSVHGLTGWDTSPSGSSDSDEDGPRGCWALGAVTGS
eukprot:SAG22_NODE_14258_length_380_cov_0.733096_1_plen_50_part_01